MKYRINYSKVISQANSISDDASQLSSLIKLLEQMEQDSARRHLLHWLDETVLLE